MKIAVYDDFRIGVIEGDWLHPIDHLLPSDLDIVPEMRINWLAGHADVLHGDTANRLRDASSAHPPVPLAGLRLLPCSPAPRHVFALPGNYREHLGEIGAMTVSGKRSANEMGFFLKAPGSLVGAGDAIELPAGSLRRFDHECELAVIVGSHAFEVPAERAPDVIFGYACAIDLTMRIDPGNREEDRSMRKSFATFTPLGPYLVTADEVGDPHNLRAGLSVNGEKRQSAHTGAMIVNVWQAIELISSVVPLSPGDVILTGTPAGVGPLRPGDDVEISIERVGSMRLPVAERKTIAPRTF
jgi:2-keto-4-pentenoate hydratase/2-oxohepta-3-ene-1,7-dioic acid hydratase in catechol pathway